MTSLPIVGGITACGIFLLMISVIGLIGAVRHHQVRVATILRKSNSGVTYYGSCQKSQFAGPLVLLHGGALPHLPYPGLKKVNPKLYDAGLSRHNFKCWTDHNVILVFCVLRGPGY